MAVRRAEWNMRIFLSVVTLSTILFVYFGAIKPNNNMTKLWQNKSNPKMFVVQNTVLRNEVELHDESFTPTKVEKLATSLFLKETDKWVNITKTLMVASMKQLKYENYTEMIAKVNSIGFTDISFKKDILIVGSGTPGKSNLVLNQMVKAMQDFNELKVVSKDFNRTTRADHGEPEETWYVTTVVTREPIKDVLVVI